MDAEPAEFNEALIESVDEVVKELFSQQVLDALHSNLSERRSISWDQIPNQLPTLRVVLEKCFGLGATTVERKIARRLYAKFSLEFPRDTRLELTDYVRNVRGQLKQPSPSPVPPPKQVKDAYAGEPGLLPLEEDLDPLLVETVRETIEDVVGKDSAQSALRLLARDFKFDQLPHHLPSFYSALGRVFGNDRGRVETAIARKLYGKLRLNSPSRRTQNYQDTLREH